MAWIKPIYCIDLKMDCNMCENFRDNHCLLPKEHIEILNKIVKRKERSK